MCCDLVLLPPEARLYRVNIVDIPDWQQSPLVLPLPIHDHNEDTLQVHATNEFLSSETEEHSAYTLPTSMEVAGERHRSQMVRHWHAPGAPEGLREIPA